MYGYRYRISSAGRARVELFTCGPQRVPEIQNNLVNRCFNLSISESDLVGLALGVVCVLTLKKSLRVILIFRLVNFKLQL